MRTTTDWLRFCLSSSASALGQHRFLNCVWELTYRCNARCSICSYWKGPADPRPELTLAEIEEGLEKVYDYGCRLVNFTGGEPTLRQDLEQIVARASSLGMWTSLVTNGSLLTRSRLNDLKEAGLDSLMVSLDSLDAAHHDRQRGVPGLQQKVLQCADWLSEDFLTGHRTGGFMTVACAHNLETIPAMVELAEERGVYILIQPYHARKTGKRAPGPGVTDELVAVLLGLKGRSSCLLNSRGYLRALAGFDGIHEHPCHAGRKYFSIDPYGGLRPCVDTASVGHVLVDDISVISSPAALREVETCGGCWYCFRGEADSTLSPGGYLEKAELAVTILRRNGRSKRTTTSRTPAAATVG
jgi:MoaA/NifB/PqqE/SkfB family radical SAM enzyme